MKFNPVEMLRTIEPRKLAQLAQDPAFLAEYDAVMAEFDRQLVSEDTWFRRAFPELGEEPIAYFCAEFGLHSSIPIYSGGLGVLAGDHCKSASDLGVPLVAVGLLYSKGYFDQRLSTHGWQESSEEQFDPNILPLVRLAGPDGSPALATLQTGERLVHIGAWRLAVGRVSVVLLDTNLPENHPHDQELTHELYGGGQAYRLRQEWILGVGGVRVLRALDIHPKAWHANEGHAAFMMVERLREHIASGHTLSEAVKRVRSTTVFTTHTPVAAGHDSFPPELIQGVCGEYPECLGVGADTLLDLGSHPATDHRWFHMTAAAIRLSSYVNGVSSEHRRVTRRVWASLWAGREPEAAPIRGITNGVHLVSWMSLRFMDLLDQGIGQDWERRVDDPETWEKVLELDDAAVWAVHADLKRQLLEFCREQARTRWSTAWRNPAYLPGSGALLGEEPLTIGFARRFSGYKRAHLLLLNEDRLERLLTDRRRPVQVIFAGKAHPADDGAKGLLQRVWEASGNPRYHGRIAFLEDYELYAAHRMVQGVDLWLNLPRVPLEASGTSGMKAALNCVPQLSTLDGWWVEGFDGDNGWAIPRVEGSDQEVDHKDHEALFALLEQEVVPLFYERDEAGIPRGWVRRMKHALRTAGSRFTSRRMVQDYTREMYAPALRGTAQADDPPNDLVAILARAEEAARKPLTKASHA
jgi:starch phosphorylase